MKKFVKICFKIFLFIFVLLSCGKKTPPLPIEKSIPENVSFKIIPTEASLDLLIILPTKTKGGYALTKIKKIVIEKKEKSLDIPNIKEKKKIIKISPKIHSAGNIYIYSDYKVKHRYQYKYRIKVIKDFLVKTPFTEEKIAYWHNPPNIPPNFKIRFLKPDAVYITWDRPSKDIFGLYLEGKVFYRLKKITSKYVKIWEIKDRTEFFDNKVKPFKKICYRIRAVLNFRGTLIPGPESPEKCIEIK